MITVDVQPAEYARLLGYPRGWILKGRAGELADWARSWYAANGHPSVHTRHVECLEISTDSIRIDGTTFTSGRLWKMLNDAEAHTAVLAAVSAGPELEEEAQRLWRDDRPDEYFFLETFGSAVVEHLTTMTGAQLCDWAETHEMAVLPHYSPGYVDWDIGEQPRLLELMKPSLAGSIEALESGALRPKKSQLAVFGVTRHTEHLRRLTELIPCENCALASCGYRRVPFKSAPKYTVNQKALRRWAGERLSIERQQDGSIHARFRYDGTTCTNMGRPLAFDYQVTLGRREEGYPIREQHCAPAPADTGYQYMCQYIKDPAPLMAAIDQEKPLLGKPLNSVFSWQRPNCVTRCYCDAGGRDHKWGLVLETIHYALAK